MYGHQRDLTELTNSFPERRTSVLRGRGLACGAAIDPLHWRMEAGCALIGAVALGAMPNPGGVGWALLGWMLLTLAILDWRHFWLPDALTLPLAFLGLTIGLWSTDVALIDRIIEIGRAHV